MVAGLLALFAVSPVVLAADVAGVCATSGSIANSLTSLDLTTDPASANFRPGQIQPTCGDHPLESLSIGLASGNELTLSLSLSQLEVDRAVFHVDRISQGEEATDWLLVSPAAGEMISGQPIDLALTVAATADLVPESRHHQIVRISFHDGTESWSIDLPVTLRVDAEQSLFRDQFEVDPVLGQFSFRLPAQSTRSPTARGRSGGPASASE